MPPSPDALSSGRRLGEEVTTEFGPRTQAQRHFRHFDNSPGTPMVDGE